MKLCQKVDCGREGKDRKFVFADANTEETHIFCLCNAHCRELAEGIAAYAKVDPIIHAEEV